MWAEPFLYATEKGAHNINTGYSLNACPPIKETIIYSIQQIIVAVFNVIPVPLLIGAGIGLSSSEITILVAGCLLVTGIATKVFYQKPPL